MLSTVCSILTISQQISVKLQERDLVHQTVGGCSPGQAIDGGLVWDHGQEDVQVVLKEGEVPGILISEINWQEIE